jgi:hypothetical protein
MGRHSSRLAGCIPSFADVAFLMPPVFLFGRLEGAHTLLSDGDTGWHIRAGEWILRHGRVPHHDLFSFTLPGKPWFAWEWLSELLMAWLHRSGMAAVVLAATIVLSLTFALLYRLLRARSGNVLIAIGLTGVAVAGSSIHWLARPHLLTLLFTVIFLGILESRESRLLWLLPPLTALWTNLHAGFAFGILLIAGYAMGQRASACAWTAVASLAASLANPYGWHLHAHIARYLAADSWQFDHINEFLSPNFHSRLALCFELMLALAAAAAFWHLTRRRIHYVLLALGPAHMALVSARNIPLFLIVAAVPVAVAIEEWLEAGARSGLPRLAHRMVDAFTRLAADTGAVERLARVPAASLVCCGLLAAGLFAPSVSGKFRSEFDARAFPAGAIPALRDSGGRIFTSDQWGDYLIYRLYPDINVFVDGRSDFYGGDHEQICQDVWNVRHDWEQKLARYRVDTVLLPAEAPLAGALKESGRWRVAYDDGRAIVFRAAGGVPVSGGSLTANNPPDLPQITLRSEPE